MPNYVEPFFGSGALLLGRPHAPGIETVNDLDGFVSNFWRALSADPAAVAEHADWPVNENDLHARHAWLVGQRDPMQAQLEGDPDWFDVKIAGWWVWGMACWIGGGFCNGDGPWQVADVDGVRQLVRLGSAGQGVKRRRVHLGNAGQGVNRKSVHLGNAGRGVNRKSVRIGDAGRGDALIEYMSGLAERMRGVRVCCGDWTRVCGPIPTVVQGLTGVVLDPPYGQSMRTHSIYRVETPVSEAVRLWALEWGVDSRMRIALCGYEGEHEMPGWDCFEWKARGGYGSYGDEEDGAGRANSRKERIWFSPHCLKAKPTARNLVMDFDAPDALQEPK